MNYRELHAAARKQNHAPNKEHKCSLERRIEALEKKVADIEKTADGAARGVYTMLWATCGSPTDTSQRYRPGFPVDFSVFDAGPTGKKKI